MCTIPKKRLLVYLIAGAAVLVVGTLGLVAARGGSTSSAGGIVIDAGGVVEATGTTPYGTGGLVDEIVPGGSATTSPPITTTTEARIWVQVTGAIRCPGVYEMAVGTRVFEVVLQAGGFSDDADQEAIALAALLSDGCTVHVPRLGEARAGEVQGPAQSSAGVIGGSDPTGPATGSSAGLVSLNTATLEQLDGLPGIGPALAQQIVTYRETQGPFMAVDQLTDVPGIGAAKLEQLRPLVGL